MNEQDYNDYLTDLTNLDYSAGYVDQHLEGIDSDLQAYYFGREV